MQLVITAVAGLISIVSLAASIIFLIQLFKAKGAVHLILGIVSCCIYPLIWGWMNADKLDASSPPVLLKYKQWILIWTICWVINIGLNIAMRAAM